MIQCRHSELQPFAESPNRTIFDHDTDRPLSAVLNGGYFDPVARLLRTGDEINVVCRCAHGVDVAHVVVGAVGAGRVTIRPLLVNEAFRPEPEAVAAPGPAAAPRAKAKAAG